MVKLKINLNDKDVLCDSSKNDEYLAQANILIKILREWYNTGDILLNKSFNNDEDI